MDFKYLVVLKGVEKIFTYHFFVSATLAVQFVDTHKQEVWRVYKLTDLTDLYTGSYLEK